MKKKGITYMKAFMLDGFIDLSGFFDEFIKKNPVFSKSENVQFLIFNPDFTSIEYVHNSTASLARKEDFEAFNKLTSESNSLKKMTRTPKSCMWPRYCMM